jgi:filamentous hemagglutinin family protein
MRIAKLLPESRQHNYSFNLLFSLKDLKKCRHSYSLLLVSFSILLFGQASQAQIVPDRSTATEVNGNTILPTGSGTVNGNNLYHSFDKFNVPNGGVVFDTGNSVNGANIQNILNRITGDTPTSILGTIQSKQAFPNANLWLLNPNGIIFGTNARLDIGGSFFATTATGIGFENSQVFRAIKDNSFPTGDPQSIRFGVITPAGILNQGQLAVEAGKNISLIGGTVFSSGSLIAPNGNVGILTASGNSLVELRSPDAVVGLAIPRDSIPNDWTGKITELPKLAAMLTGAPETNQVRVNSNGFLSLDSDKPLETNIIANGKFDASGSIILTPGDIAIKSLTANNIKIQAVGSLFALVPNFRATGNLDLLATKNILIRDSLSQPATIQANGNLKIEGNQAIDILALNYPNNPITSLGNLTLSSDGQISADAHYFSGGQFKINTISGGIANFVSQYDPIISSIGDVSFGDYTGAALKVESQGSISAGNITITSADIGLVGSDPDIPQLISGKTLILRAGAIALANPTNLPTQIGNTNFSTTTATNPGSITVNSINTLSSAGINGGNVTLTAPGNITIRNEVNTQVRVVDGTLNETGNGGNVLIASGGAITFNGGRIITGAAGNGKGGDVSLNAERDISGITNVIQTDGGASTGNGGNISVISNSGQVAVGLVRSNSNFDNGGNITFTANTGSISFGVVNSEGGKRAGNINIFAPQGRVNGTETFPALDGTASTVSAQAGLPTFSPTPLQGGIGGDITIQTALGISASLAGTVTNRASQVNSPPRIINSSNPPNPNPPNPNPPNPNPPNPNPPNPNPPNPNPPNPNPPRDIELNLPTVSSNSINSSTVSNSSVSTFTNQLNPNNSNPIAILNVSSPSISESATAVTERSNESPSSSSESATAVTERSNESPSSSSASQLQAIAKTELANVRNQTGQFLEKGQLPEAFKSVELSSISELSNYVGKSLAPAKNLSISDAQSQILNLSQATDSRSALIYPIILSDRLEILVIPPSGKPFYRSVPAARKDIIEKEIAEFRENLLDPSSSDYLVQAKQLYNWVIRPIEAKLEEENIKTLVFVMDGALRVTPVAAFHDGKQFLVEKYATASIPSLQLTNLQERDRRNNRVLAMGLSEATQGLSALPAVPTEIDTISTRILEGEAFLNIPFTVDNLKTQRSRGNYAIVHLATHAQFLEARNSSFIQFYGERLKIGDILKLRFDSPPIEMLTLSACQTALGNNLGISGAAIESGAKSVLASLWTVSDAGTTPLMFSFYGKWKNSQSKALALQQAQLSLLKRNVRFENNRLIGIPQLDAIPLQGAGDLSHPYYWSSFILVGNWL